MILYICTDTYEQYCTGTGWTFNRKTIEDISQDACLILHYSQVNLDVLAKIQPWAICHSGGVTDYDDYDVLQAPNYLQVVREFPVAQIGFCGGHQILANIFGSSLGPMRRLRPDEPDHDPYSAGYFKEWGVYPVQIVSSDALFQGCGDSIHVHEYHYWEVKELAEDLVLLASTAGCRVQAFRHREKPVYGTQFHPEKTNDTYRDGARVLENFFKLAKEREGR
jgi:GMP synthase-like glutamine amidotransferase